MHLEIIYLVVALTGTHDSSDEWVVAALLTLEAAMGYRDEAAKASEAAIAAYKASPEGQESKYANFDGPTNFDLAHSVQDSRLSYRIVPVPLVTGALDSRGLLAIAGAYASAVGVTREINHPGLSQRLGLPLPQPRVPVTGDFSSKLQTALQA